MSVIDPAIIARSVIEEDELNLRAFSERRDADAFAKLVRRHVHLVHGTALRALGGDITLADDVTQAVFVIFAKKAASIRGAAALPAWLHQTTLYAVSNAKKTRARRRYHESRAAVTRSEVSMADSPAGDSGSDSIVALLDQGIATLGARDRTAILARYFQGASASDIAQQENTSPEVAQKRLERAVERLRAFFRKSNAKITAAGISATLVASAAHAAPSQLITTITSNSLSIAASASVAGITQGTLSMMAWIKIKLAVLCAVAGALVTTTGISVAQLAGSEPNPITQSSTASSTSIKGRWTFIASARDGKLLPDDALKKQDQYLVIDDETIQLFAQDQLISEHKYIIDPGGKTGRIELSEFRLMNDGQAGEPGGKVMLGIYDVNADTLRIYFDDQAKQIPAAIPDDPKDAKLKLWVLKPAQSPTTSQTTPENSPENLRRTAALLRLRALTMRLLSYRNRQSSLPPESFVVTGNDGKPLVSPYAKDGSTTGYVYLGNQTVSVADIKNPRTTIIVYDQASQSDDGVAAGFLDGHIEWIGAADFEAVLKSSKEAMDAAKTK
ncbi:MAG: sigma-70 family RNA polymerase sigma factor [Burkholderiales bacterium]|nr:sigma-70 family RNA polymerase sigma factor [Phycisphaerae bacterium]